MTRQCSNCESKILLEDKVCSECGADLDKQRMKEQQKNRRNYDT
jgi:DNA-directed RNA polymerase subunit RPC12/RpoP